MAEQRTKDELVEAKAILHNGDLIALPSGNLYVLFMIEHDRLTGETVFDYRGLAQLTGAYHTLRRVKP